MTQRRARLARLLLLAAACLELVAAQGGGGGRKGGGFRSGSSGGGIIIVPMGGGAGGILGSVVFVFLVVLFYLVTSGYSRSSGSAAERQPVQSEGESYGAAAERPPPAEVYVQGGSAAPHAARLPSGTWRGYYDQYGYEHQVCEFSLTFADGKVGGSGVDDVGAYQIEGVYGGPAGRVAFQKKYIAGSANDAGRVRHDENLGHVAEYRGEPAGPQLGQGLRGSWFVETSRYRGSGRWMLWPVVDLYSAEAAEAGEAFMRDHPTFTVAEDNKCAVCFENAIDVVLDPCGHITVCSECAARLSPKKCPICRDSIRQVLPAGARPGVSRERTDAARA